jgi:hypothetical protein
MGTTTLKYFNTLVGADPYSLNLDFTVTKGVEKGKSYSFRYRAINAVGAGPWSAVTVLTAATVPLAPPIPKYFSSSANSITLKFDLSADNGGSKITGYKLIRDNGNLLSDINVPISGYDGIASMYTVSGLTSGMKYRFQYIASNFYGDSFPSDPLTIAASELPPAPNKPYVDWSRSSKTSLYIYWDPVADPPSPILGYILQIDDGRGSAQFTTIYDGSFVPGQTYFLKSGLTNGLPYRFRVYAVNFNGKSVASQIGTYYACTAPTKFAAPVMIA